MICTPKTIGRLQAVDADGLARAYVRTPGGAEASA